MSRPLNPTQLAERVVMVLKTLEDLELGTQREVLEAAAATIERLEKKA